MTDLSPAAQAIWDAWWKANNRYAIQDLGVIVRAAADQVVPEQELDDVPGRFVNGCCHEQRQQTRAELLAIAAELEGR